MHQTTCHNELDWTAFCYAAGELSASEADAFEVRLADDQAAREALARAVELSQAVAAAETMEPVSVGRSGRSRGDVKPWGKRLVWMAIGSAASLLVAALVSQLSGWLGQSVVGDDGRLAAAWSQTRQELSVASDADLWYLNHLDHSDHLDAVDRTAVGVNGAAVEVTIPDVNNEELDLIATPDWLTAAVRGTVEMPDDGTATPDELLQPADGDSTPFDGDSREN
jgi:hypothetical protein